MPRILGVIAEYNPFHLGHAYQLREARDAYQADHVVVVMSGFFTQRGDAALLSPRDRAEMALRCGADAVFALPAVWAARDAEHFALGGVAILAALGCDAISFGTEHADIGPLMAAARCLEQPDAAFTADMQRRLADGVPYPAAVAAAAEAVCPGAGAVLSTPNSTLAVCYLRAMLKLHSPMDVVPVLRCADYHDTTLGDALPSATALRGAILRGDWGSARKAMPEAAFDVLCRSAASGRLHRPEALDAALLARLRTMTDTEYAALPDVSEGIEHRLHAAAQSCCTRETMLQSAKTRRYPYARLSRLATHALLGLTHSALADIDLPAPWLLGFREDSRTLISLLASHTRLLARSSDLDPEEPWFAAETRAADLWALGAGLPAGLARKQGVVIV